MKKVWVVCGPTASGKTGFAIALARKVHAEILSADSRQVYRELNIGVARPDMLELEAVPHHFIATVSIQEDFTAGRFAREARSFMVTYFKSHNDLVVCGGTGLYLKALLEGIDRLPVPEEVRQKVNDLLEEGGQGALVRKLSELDPELASTIAIENPRRVQRALEWVMAGKPEGLPPDWPDDWKVEKLALELPREELYDRINRRVDAMMDAGLWEEAVALFPFRHLNALKTVGYQELFDPMEGRCSREAAVEKIKQHTRNYAKRQITWFRKDPEIRWLKPEDQAEMTGGLPFSQGS